MPNKCSIEGCHKKPSTVSLHRFPTNIILCQMWKEALGKPKEWLPTESDIVCSSHFDPAVIVVCGSNASPLECAVPRKSVFVTDTSTKLMPDHDHTYALPDAKILKRRLDFLVNKIEDHQSKQTNVNKREKRLRLSLSSILAELKERRILTEDMHLKLQAYSDIPVDLFNRTAKEYTEEQKDFALTLHMQSGKAYEC